MKRLRKAGASSGRLFRFIGTLIHPLILYCSPVVFTGLLKLDFNILRRQVCLISPFTFVPNHTIVTRLVERHMLSTSFFVERILDDDTHPLHEPCRKSYFSPFWKYQCVFLVGSCLTPFRPFSTEPGVSMSNCPKGSNYGVKLSKCFQNVFSWCIEG